MLAGDFYAEWLVTKRSLQNQETTLASKLVETMILREDMILTSDAFLAAVLVDLRYQVLLSKDQRLSGMKQLIAIWNSLCFCNRSVYDSIKLAESNESFNSGDTNANADGDAIEIILREADAVEEIARSGSGLEQRLEAALSGTRFPRDGDIVKYWCGYPDEDVRSIALTAIALPTTQHSSAQHDVAEMEGIKQAKQWPPTSQRERGSPSAVMPTRFGEQRMLGDQWAPKSNPAKPIVSNAR
ncbi:hypothetical protein AC1031_011965 [Aphanomyces cochlioides]|nr:hypothetical protein AC1031_011965 [Aphanomyces cochlioides]